MRAFFSPHSRYPNKEPLNYHAQLNAYPLTEGNTSIVTGRTVTVSAAMIIRNLEARAVKEES